MHFKKSKQICTVSVEPTATEYSDKKQNKTCNEQKQMYLKVALNNLLLLLATENLPHCQISSKTVFFSLFFTKLDALSVAPLLQRMSLEHFTT